MPQVQRRAENPAVTTAAVAAASVTAAQVTPPADVVISLVPPEEIAAAHADVAAGPAARRRKRRRVRGARVPGAEAAVPADTVEHRFAEYMARVPAVIRVKRETDAAPDEYSPGRHASPALSP